jgi:HEAT repeat protein
MIASTGDVVGRSFFVAHDGRYKMVIYCTRCWKDNPAGSQVCQRCGAKLEADNRSFIAKLLQALSHPEPMTVERAAWILGELKASEAVVPLIHLLLTSQDMGALEKAVEALGKIGDERAVDFLSKQIASSYLSVRLQTVKALKRIGGDSALSVLKKALNDPVSSVSLEAKAALGILESGEIKG